MAIENNQLVSIEYELTLEGEVVDSNIGQDPLEFTFGSGQIIPGLEAQMTDMNEGDERQITVKAADAYGEYNPEAKQVLPKEQFGNLELQVGMPLQGQGEDGQPVQVVVTAIEDDQVEIDLNHPLAGKDLEFKIVVKAIK